MRIANALPPCRPNSKPFAVLYLVPAPNASIPGRLAIVRERCYAVDGEFVVKRAGKRIAASSLNPMPDAIQMIGGKVHVGFDRVYANLADFAADNAADPSAKPLGIEALKRPSAGRLALG